jgi:hypothetical protein
VIESRPGSLLGFPTIPRERREQLKAPNPILMPALASFTTAGEQIVAALRAAACTNDRPFGLKKSPASQQAILAFLLWRVRGALRCRIDADGPAGYQNLGKG